MDWQPIKSAPKDGTLIMLADADIAAPGRWQEAYEDESDNMGQDGGFVDCDYQIFYPSRSFGAVNRMYEGKQPTHWMPLPEPPKQADISEGK